MGLMRSAHFTMAKLPRLCTSQARRAKAAAAASNSKSGAAGRRLAMLRASVLMGAASPGNK